MKLNPESLKPVLQEAAENYILPRYKALKDNEISSKSNPTDLVTLADIEAEMFLEQKLPQLLNGSLVVGEESVSKGIKSLDILSDESQTIWVVDPVDGTYNFVHGGTDFGIMVSLVHGGETIGGWIYDVLNENLTFSMKGEGVYDDKTPIKFSNDISIREANELEIFLSPKFFPRAIRENIKDKRKQFKKSDPKGCSAHEYLNVLRGKRQACVYCRLKPWDHLPGTFMISEAGGYVSKWDGAPYTPQDVYGGLIAARSKENWEIIFDTLFHDIDFEKLKKN